MREFTNVLTSSLVGRLIIGSFIAGALAGIAFIGCAEFLLYAVTR